MRINRQINGIYNTVCSDNNAYFVPRFYPYIMKINLDNFECDECFRIQHEIGKVGVILLDDSD